MSSQLALALREGTKKAHTMAENVGFVRCFLKGVVEKQSYRKLVANFYFVYGALEAAMAQHREHPVVGPLYFPELVRQPALERDLAFYYGAQWREEIRLSPAGQVRFVNDQGEMVTQEFEDFVARIVQHEYDHLQGTLFVERQPQRLLSEAAYRTEIIGK